MRVIRERRLYGTIGGKVISGGTDLFLMEEYRDDLFPRSSPKRNTVLDYKFTSVYAYILGDHLEWEQQLNVYRWLWHLAGYRVDALEICCIFRDWSETRFTRERDYPPPFVVLQQPMWSLEQTEAYILERIRVHDLAQTLPDSELPPCTDRERWMRPEKYAVHKQGRKSALKLCDSPEEAVKYVTDGKAGDTGYIEHRPAVYKRCQKCKVQPFCHQYKNGRRGE